MIFDLAYGKIFSAYNYAYGVSASSLLYKFNTDKSVSSSFSVEAELVRSVVSGIACDADKNIYCCGGWDDDACAKYNSAGVVQATWGGSGTGNGQFSLIRGFDISDEGLLFVGDYSLNSVQVFDLDGVYQYKWGSYGSTDGKFNKITALAVGPNGDVYVADRDNQRVQQFNQDGTFVRKWSTGYAYNLTIDENGFVYVYTTTGYVVRKYSSIGVYQSEWGLHTNSSGNYRSNLSGKFYYTVSVAGSSSLYRCDYDGTNEELVASPASNFYYSVAGFEPIVTTPGSKQYGLILALDGGEYVVGSKQYGAILSLDGGTYVAGEKQYGMIISLRVGVEGSKQYGMIIAMSNGVHKTIPVEFDVTETLFLGSKVRIIDVAGIDNLPFDEIGGVIS